MAHLLRFTTYVPASGLLNCELWLPDQNGFPAHAHHTAGSAFSLGPFRFVVVGELRRYLPPRPTRQRPRQPALPPRVLEPVSVDDHEKLHIRAVQMVASAQTVQRTPVGEH